MIGSGRGRSVRADEGVLQDPATSAAVRAAHDQWSTTGHQPYLYRPDDQQVLVRLRLPARTRR